MYKDNYNIRIRCIFWFCFIITSDTEIESTTQKVIGWMDKHLLCRSKNKGVIYDFETTKDFLTNTVETTVFSPVCSEMNVYLQACSGEYSINFYDEYADDFIGCSKEYLEKLVDVLEAGNKEDKTVDSNKKGSNVFVANSIFIPSDRSEHFPQSSSAYEFESYDSRNSLDLLKKHENFVKQKTNNLLSSSLKEEAFNKNFRIYTSAFYFKDNWLQEFYGDKTREDNFTFKDGSVVKRMFMNIDENYVYELIEKDGLKFEVVALPYITTINKNVHKRYMIYLIPDDKATDLSLLWNEFNIYTYFNIRDYLMSSLKERRIILQIPKLVNFESILNINEILKNTYGSGPSAVVSSLMKTKITVNETGTEAVALNETCVADCGFFGVPLVKANRPHVAFIYDMSIKRVLFVINDIGEKK